MSPSKSDVLKLGALGPIAVNRTAGPFRRFDCCGRYCFFELKPHWRGISSAYSPRGLHEAVDLRAVPRSEVDAGRGIPDGRAFTLTGGMSLPWLTMARTALNAISRSVSSAIASLISGMSNDPFRSRPESSPTLNSTAAKEVFSTIGHEGVLLRPEEKQDARSSR